MAFMGIIKHKHFAINTEQAITDMTKSVCHSTRWKHGCNAQGTREFSLSALSEGVWVQIPWSVQFVLFQAGFW